MKLFGRDSSKKGADAASEAGSPAPGTSGSEIGDVLALASDRIAAIVAAAEKASADINERLSARSDASAAPPGSRENIAGELARSLATRADELKTEADSLAGVLSRASSQLAATAPAPSAAPGPPPAASSEPEPDPDPAPPSPSRIPFRRSTARPAPEPAAADSAPAASAVAPGSPVPGSASAPPPVEPAAGLEAETPESAAVPEDGLSQRVDERFTPQDGPAPFKVRRSGTEEAQQEFSPEGVRLLATQMAVAGSSREEIEARLSREFGIEDTAEILSDVLRGRSGLGRRVAG